MVSAAPSVSLHFRPQRRQSTMSMITSDLIRQVAKDSFDGIGSWAIARLPEQDEVRVARQPAADIPCRVNTIVVRYHVHRRKRTLEAFQLGRVFEGRGLFESLAPESLRRMTRGPIPL